MNRLILFITLSLMGSAKAESLLNSAAQLKKISGETFEKKNFTQPVLVVQFWASWCKGCGDTMMDLESMTQGKNQIKFFTVSIDEELAPAKKYLDKLTSNNVKAKNVSDYAYLDSTATFAKAVGVNAVPFVLVLDQKGDKIFSHEGHMDAKMLSELNTKITEESKKHAH